MTIICNTTPDFDMAATYGVRFNAARVAGDFITDDCGVKAVEIVPNGSLFSVKVTMNDDHVVYAR